MAKFIKLTEIGSQGRIVAINIEAIEYILPRPNLGTELVSITHHTKYVVRESMDDILAMLGESTAECRDAQETPSVMEVKEMKTIVFDETCAGWTKYPDLNATYLGLQKDFLNEKLIAKRYMYLSEIYETLGVAWNPEDKNICYLAEFGPIDVEFEPTGEGNYLIKIH